MATAIVMPKLGMTMQEGTVIEWPIAIGAWVEKGAVVLIIESEKAEAEVEATDSGYLRHIYAEPDAVVPCGTAARRADRWRRRCFRPRELSRQRDHDVGPGARGRDDRARRTA